MSETYACCGNPNGTKHAADCALIYNAKTIAFRKIMMNAELGRTATPDMLGNERAIPVIPCPAYAAMLQE